MHGPEDRSCCRAGVEGVSPSPLPGVGVTRVATFDPVLSADDQCPGRLVPQPLAPLVVEHEPETDDARKQAVDEPEEIPEERLTEGDAPSQKSTTRIPKTHFPMVEPKSHSISVKYPKVIRAAMR